MANHSIGRRCLHLFSDITVEPILFLSMLAMNIYNVVQQVGVYNVVCLQTYAHHPEINCNHLGNVTVDGVSAENVIQKKVTMWNMALGLSYLIPGLFADIFLGAFGDRYGRKINILLGMGGLMISLYPLILLFSYPLYVPLLYILVLLHVFSGFTGFITISMISAFAYLADTVLDPESLTIRMTVMGVVMSAASIAGPLIAGATTKALTRSQTILVCQAFLSAAFFFCLFRIRQMPPTQLRRKLIEKLEKRNGKPVPQEKLTPAVQSEKTEPAPSPATTSICSLIINLLKETWHTYAKPRPGHGRLYLACASLVFFLQIVSELGLRQSIFALYVQKAPLSWNQDSIGYFKSAQASMHIVGTIMGILIFKKALGFTDTFIVLIASASHIAETLLMAFADSTWLVYTAAATGLLSGMQNPCMQSFIAKQVGSDEVGKAFTAFGVSANVGFLISNVVYNPIYYATVSFFPGFVFIFATVLLGFGFLAVLWMHVDVHFKTQQADVLFRKKFARSIFSAKKRPAAGPNTAKVVPVDVVVAPEKMQMA